MARGGINKVLVDRARKALAARGQSASIDAVRVELGNTGSRTTIHRYLRELEAAEAETLEGEEKLSQELQDFVSQLAARLHQEADAVIAQARERHEQEIGRLDTQWNQTRQELAQATQQNEALVRELAQLRDHLAQTQQRLNAEQIETTRLRQELDDSKARLGDKDAQIRSLEEKHQHGRDALEHYRQAVKDQREQEQRRHEHQVQQLQAELRQLQQAQIVKQNDLTELSKDNARLAAELRDANKQVVGAERRIQKLETEAESLTSRLQQAESAREAFQRDIQALQSAQTQWQDAFEQESQTRRQLEVELTKARTEAEIKDRLLSAWQDKWPLQSSPQGET